MRLMNRFSIRICPLSYAHRSQRCVATIATAQENFLPVRTQITHPTLEIIQTYKKGSDSSRTWVFAPVTDTDVNPAYKVVQGLAQAWRSSCDPMPMRQVTKLTCIACIRSSSSHPR
jgi:hypothetical protein